MATTALPKVMVGRPARPAVPPLFNGDHMDRIEFERRYDAMPDGTRAELIDGVVYMAPPVSHDWHSRPQYLLITVFGLYESATPGVIGGDNGSIRLDPQSMPQPDIYLMIDPTRGGQSAVDADGYVAGAPELVAEVSASSRAVDLHQKLEMYRRNGIKEYIVWRTADEAFDHFALSDSEYQPLSAEPRVILKSAAYPGLWINTNALIAGDLATALATLQEGIASPEHAAFVSKLNPVQQQPKTT